MAINTKPILRYKDSFIFQNSRLIWIPIWASQFFLEIKAVRYTQNIIKGGILCIHIPI